MLESVQLSNPLKARSFIETNNICNTWYYLFRNTFAYNKSTMPTLTCSLCNCLKPKADFASSERKKSISKRLCRSCKDGNPNRASREEPEQLSTGGGSSVGDNAPLLVSPGWSSAQDESTITVEKGKRAVIVGLESEADLNGSHVIIQKVFEDDKVSVTVPEPIYTPGKTIAISRKNLVLRDLCPICMDTEMDTETTAEVNSSYYWCCAKRTCKACHERTPNPNRCPICQADRTHDCDRAQEKWVMKRAKQGDPAAMYNVAWLYDTGAARTIRQNQSLARDWYGRAVHKGHRDAAHNLACSHRDGEGGPVNLEEAFRLYIFAAERGNDKAMTNVGDAYLTGRGVAKNIDKAEVWYKKAAAAGNPRGPQKLEAIAMVKAGIGTLNMVPLGSGRFYTTFDFSRP